MNEFTKCVNWFTLFKNRFTNFDNWFMIVVSWLILVVRQFANFLNSPMIPANRFKRFEELFVI